MSPSSSSRYCCGCSACLAFPMNALIRPFPFFCRVRVLFGSLVVSRMCRCPWCVRGLSCALRTQLNTVLQMVASERFVIALIGFGWCACFSSMSAPPTLLPFIKSLGIESRSDFVHCVTKAGYEAELKTCLAASQELADDRMALARLRAAWVVGERAGFEGMEIDTTSSSRCTWRQLTLL